MKATPMKDLYWKNRKNQNIIMEPDLKTLNDDIKDFIAKVETEEGKIETYNCELNSDGSIKVQVMVGPLQPKLKVMGELQKDGKIQFQDGDYWTVIKDEPYQPQPELIGILAQQDQKLNAIYAKLLEEEKMIGALTKQPDAPKPNVVADKNNIWKLLSLLLGLLLAGMLIKKLWFDKKVTDDIEDNTVHRPTKNVMKDKSGKFCLLPKKDHFDLNL